MRSRATWRPTWPQGRWCRCWPTGARCSPGVLYWPSRRHVTPALRAVIEVLRIDRAR
ncbi:hypothetical protein [Nannocystis pusilla]|uniref:hypothetical protein n=1 Tax=Nannocystis pusilla TaxID=889268 RepID=UPI003B78246A